MFRFASLLLLCVALVACTDPTSPSEDSEKVYVMSIPSQGVEDPSAAWILFGTGTPLHDMWDLGFRTLHTHESNGITEHRLILTGSEMVNIVLTVPGAGGLQSQEGKAPEYRFLSDWGAVDPHLNRGVRYDNRSEFSILVRKSKIQDMRIVDVGSELIFQTSNSTNSTVKLNFPIDDLTRFVVPRQIRRVGCAGTGSLTLRAPVLGLTESYESDLNAFLHTRKVREVTITCTEFANATEARRALLSQ